MTIAESAQIQPEIGLSEAGRTLSPARFEPKIFLEGSPKEKRMATEDRTPDRSGARHGDRLHECGLDFSVATTVDDVVEAWRLVYREYLRAGLIDSNPCRVYTHEHAVHSGTAVIVGKIRSVVVSTMSAFVDRPGGLPLDVTTGAAMQALRANGRRLVEVGLFADRREKIARSFAALLNLMRHAFFFAKHSGGTDIVIGVHPHHKDFYQRLLGFEVFAESTSCHRVKDHPMVPMRLDIDGQLSCPRPPKGIAFFKANPLGPEAFAERLPLKPRLIEDTVINRFLAAEPRPARGEFLTLDRLG